MKNPFFIFALSLIVLASCNNKTKNKETVAVSNKINETAACYSYSKDNDSVILHITITDNLASGDLVYNYFQKDKNIGKINGEMKGDTLYVEYTFQSEGVNSVREVAFLKKGNEWIEGYGDLEEQSGKMVFKNKATLNFKNNITLKQTKCNTDEHGSLLSFGYVWSSVKNSSIQLSETATRLNPIEAMDKDKSPAYIVFSKDQSKAELFLPQIANSLLLDRTGTEGNYIWKNNEWELIVWKGYVLKKNKVAVYGGQ
jgi:hypothetical protein